ncbi:MAG: sodium:solute symporter family protein [Bacillota bacterium]|nr:sodium:solute symporter family protein [Bacillota bacterium]
MVIFVFTFIPLILAEVARKSALPTVEDFFLQSREMSLLLSFFTIYATWVSSFAFLGATSSFYSTGPVYLTCFAWNALFGLLFMVMGRRLWRYGKRRGYVTPTDFFNDIYRYRPLNLIVTAVMLLFTIPYLMIQLSGGAYLIETVTEGLIPWRAAGLVFYLVIIIYLWAGGLRAVAMADVFYGSLVFLSMLVTGFFLIRKAGGVETAFHFIMETEAEAVVLGGGLEADGPAMWLAMFVMVPVGALMGPQMWIRSFAVKRGNTFRLMPFLITFATIMYLGPILSGAAGRVLLPGFSQTDGLIPQMLMKTAPQLLCAVLLCGIAAAALSTANSQIHALAAIYTIDIHRRYLNPAAPDNKLVSVGKWAVLGASAVAYLLLLQSPTLILETGTMGMAGTAQIFVPTVGALFWKRSNARAALAGLLTGVGSLVGLAALMEMGGTYAGCLALAANAAVFILLSLGLPTDMQTRERILTYKATC